MVNYGSNKSLGRKGGAKMAKLSKEGAANKLSEEVAAEKIAYVLRSLGRKANRPKLFLKAQELAGSLAVVSGTRDWASLEALFDSQVKVYEGNPRVQEILLSQKELVLSKASNIDLGGKIPFVPVVPSNYFGSNDPMVTVQHKGKVGYASIDPGRVRNEILVPSGIYYMYGVDCGNDTCGINPLAATNVLKARSMSPLVSDEAVAICRHTDVLLHHSVWAANSRYESTSMVVAVYLDNDDRPKLHFDRACGSSVRWGTPSCMDRL